MNATLFFRACDGPPDPRFRRPSNCELWKTDGTEAGTMRVKEINPNGGSSPELLTKVGEMLFFRACDGPPDSGGPTNCELWKSDGTEAGTVRVKDINPAGSGIPNPFGRRPFIEFSGRLVFQGCDGPTDARGRPTNCELWESYGTEDRTRPTEDLNGSPPGSYPSSFAPLNDAELLFVACDGLATTSDCPTRCGLWKGLHSHELVKEISSSGDPVVDGYTNVKDTLFFSACTEPLTCEPLVCGCNNYYGCSLWKTDGTIAGTGPVVDNGLPVGDRPLGT